MRNALVVAAVCAAGVATGGYAAQFLHGGVPGALYSPAPFVQGLFSHAHGASQASVPDPRPLATELQALRGDSFNIGAQATVHLYYWYGGPNGSPGYPYGVTPLVLSVRRLFRSQGVPGALARKVPIGPVPQPDCLETLVHYYYYHAGPQELPGRLFGPRPLVQAVIRAFQLEAANHDMGPLHGHSHGHSHGVGHVHSHGLGHPHVHAHGQPRGLAPGDEIGPLAGQDAFRGRAGGLDAYGHYIGPLLGQESKQAIGPGTDAELGVESVVHNYYWHGGLGGLPGYLFGVAPLIRSVERTAITQRYGADDAYGPHPDGVMALVHYFYWHAGPGEAPGREFGPRPLLDAVRSFYLRERTKHAVVGAPVCANKAFHV